MDKGWSADTETKETRATANVIIQGKGTIHASINWILVETKVRARPRLLNLVDI